MTKAAGKRTGRLRLRTFAAALLLSSSGHAASTRPAAEASPAHPNVLIILADDLGYSDLGSYGSEIATPNLDRLAADGVRLTHFHANPSCSPTRASLLSGADQHTAGVGVMAEAVPPPMRGHAGFEGTLSTRVATLAERFAAAGYRTTMSGKWHLGQAVGERPGDRGFQTSFALMQGAANHFGLGGFGSEANPMTAATYLLNGRPYTPRSNFYSSDVYAERLIAQLKHGDPAKPFFAYLAFTAPHSPLQAPARDIAAYRGRYTDGWARLAQRRLAAMRTHQVLPGTIPGDPATIGPTQASWDQLSSEGKARESRKAEVYAAMITRLDRDVGRVLDYLDRSGQRQNTIIVFLSDNGAAGETPDRFSSMPGVAEKVSAAAGSVDAIGSARSFAFYGPNWALASSAPSRMFKGFLTEGGTLVPAIWSYRGLPAGGSNAVIGDVRDIAPTLLGLAGLPAGDVVDGRRVAYLEGADLWPWLSSGRSDRPIEAVANEFYGQAMVRSGRWKLLRLAPPFGDGKWRLFDTFADPHEDHNRLAEQPALASSMKASWQRYAARIGVPAELPARP